MDHFGIGAAVAGVVLGYFRAARRTGRTVSMMESVKDEDVLCFTEAKEAERVARLCKERGVNVTCIVVDPARPERIWERGTAQGRFLFDHSWVERYYLQAMERASADIDHMQRQMSGYGEAHRETRRRAEELAKWRV